MSTLGTPGLSPSLDGFLCVAPSPARSSSDRRTQGDPCLEVVTVAEGVEGVRTRTWPLGQTRVVRVGPGSVSGSRSESKRVVGRSG